MNEQTSLGARIRDLRLKKGLTQVELSKGISTPSMVSQVESDRARPSYKLLALFAERLEVSLEYLLSDVEMNLQLNSTCKMARAMMSAKEYDSAIPLWKELRSAPSTVCSQKDVLLALVECYLHTGQGEQAEPCMKTLQQQADALNDHHLLAQTGYLYGLLEFDRKHYHLAVHEWLKTVEALQKTSEPDVFLQRLLYSQLGQAYLKLGMMREAVAYLDQAADVLQETNNMHDLALTYKQLADSFMKMNQWDKVVQYAQKAQAIYEMLEHFSMKWKLQLNRAAAYAQSGRQEKAADLLETAVDAFQALGKPEETGIALAELAKVHVQQGKLELAEEACLSARSLLPELHLYQAWVQRVLGRIAQVRGQADAAIRHFEKAADCFKRVEEFVEWEATMYDLSRLHQEQQNAERALHVLDSLRNFTQKVLGERGIVL